MTYLAAVLAVTCFSFLLRFLGVAAVARRAIATAGEAATSMRDPALTDESKERAVRRASLSLFGLFLSIVIRAAAAVGVSLLPLLFFHAAGLARWDTVTALLSSWPGVTLGIAVMAVVSVVKSPRRRSSLL